MPELGASLTVADVERLMRDPLLARHWLGSRISPTAGSLVTVTDGTGVSWPGSRLADERDVVLGVRLLAPPHRDDLAGADFQIRVVPEGRGSRVVIDGDDPSDPRLAIVWEPVLSRLGSLLSAEAQRRRSPQQAVVVIHGIGEQQPGATLRSFVESIAGTSAEVSWSARDPFEPTSELRRLTLAQSEARPRTTFYEYYWAHQINDTTIGDVVGWAVRLMARSPGRLPPQLRPVWLLFWAFAAASATTVVALAGAVNATAYVSGTVTLVLGVLVRAVVRVLGDAARYLSPRPRNIAIRHTIRQGGLDLLTALHTSGRYDRIVIVGHSLGSVIAYDVLSHLWPTMNRTHHSPDAPRFVALEAVNSPPEDRTPHSLQNAVWREMRRNSQPWLVTDLVTLGSPLAHADVLLTRERAEFMARCAEGALPTAPPQRRQRDNRFTFNRRYTTRSGMEGVNFMVADDAALFAAVRWTNVYFPCRAGMFGDLVGGPIGHLLGAWVRDVPVTSGHRWWIRRTLLAHTTYWRSSPRRAKEHPDLQEAQEALRRALRLEARGDLQRHVARVDPLLHRSEP